MPRRRFSSCRRPARTTCAPRRRATTDAQAVNRTASTDEDEYDSDDEPDLTHECFKLMVLVGLIVALVLLNKEVGAALLTMKNWLLKHIPLYAYFLGYVAVQGCRRLLPPLYYAMPIGLLTIFYLVARLGWLRAGFLYQAWQMLDCVWFVGIRYVYTDKVALVLDRSREGKKIRKYLPRDVVRLLRVLDREWKRRISHGDYSVAWRVVTVALCVEIKILRRVRAESSRRPLRHRHDACSMAWRCRFLAARPSQDGSVIAEK